MNVFFEDELAVLLKQAPGEPPVAIDVDALLALPARRGRRRRPAWTSSRRWVTPALAAAAVVAVAVALALPTGVHPGVSSSPGTTSPEQLAQQAVAVAIAHAPLPPGSRRTGEQPVPTDAPSAPVGSPYLVDQFRWVTAPGTVASVSAYLQAHPPRGAQSGGAGGVIGEPPYELQFSTPNGPEYDYVLAADGRRVIIRLNVWMQWTPPRPAWSYAASTVTSADVTVVGGRQPTEVAGKRPSVHRTLTGTPARSLAIAIDKLPAQRFIASTCPMIVAPTATVTFHVASGTITISGGTACGQPTLTASGHPGIQVFLSFTFVHVVVSALGLPDDYGR